MRALILCEGNTDRILLSYYLEKVLAFHYYERKQEIRGTQLGFKEDDYDWYVNAQNDNVMLAAVRGSNFVPAIKSLVKWNNTNIHRNGDCFDKVVIVTDYDDSGAMERLRNVVRELSVGVLETECQVNQWYKINYHDGYNGSYTFDFLFLLQSQEEQGNLEVFVLNAIADAKSEDQDVATKAREYISKINKEVYLKKRREVSKAELSAFFSVVSPERTFSKLDPLLKEIRWEQYELYNKQFALLRELGSSE